MGAFLAAVATPTGNPALVVTSDWKFWLGIGAWAIGFASNIWHDEILLNIRRSKSTKSSSGPKPRYEIPYGGLYSLISYPNYLSEWFEWFGFAVAASALTAQLPGSHVAFPFAAGRLGLGELLAEPEY